MTLPLTFERIAWHDGGWWWEDVERHPQPLNLSGAPTPCCICGTTYPCACPTDLIPEPNAVPPW